MDILIDILRHFGYILISFHKKLLSCLTVQLNTQRLAIRKSSIIAISFVVASCNSVLFAQLLENILHELRKKHNNPIIKTYIQCLCSIRQARFIRNSNLIYLFIFSSSKAGHRFGKYLERIVPLIFYFCESKDEELVEYSLLTLESFVRRCTPNEMLKYVRKIIDLCSKFIKYDPNYSYDDKNSLYQEDSIEFEVEFEER